MLLEIKKITKHPPDYKYTYCYYVGQNTVSHIFQDDKHIQSHFDKLSSSLNNVANLFTLVYE